jgi:predicted N-acetyltransferase YhbS
LGNLTPESIAPPQKLTTEHDLVNFCCGVASLDDWLKKRALANEMADASRTYVVCAKDRVVGYYALAVGSIEREIVTSQIKRNMPNPVPVMILARLAVDLNWTGKGIGRGLLRDAILRTLQAGDLAGIKAILVHALSEEAKTFYQNAGFKPSPIEPLTMMLSLKEAKELLSGKMA